MPTKTDKAVFTVTATTILTFLIASRLSSIWMLYPNVLIAAALGIYCIQRINEDTALLARSAVFGLATTVTYVPMDWLFSRKAHLIFYLRPDFLANLTTPIAIILNWLVFTTLAAYSYQRLATVLRAGFTEAAHNSRMGFVGISVLAGSLTGIAAALGSITVYALGAGHLWEWNAAQVDQIPQIAAVPAFVPVSFLCTFLLCPYFFGITRKPVGAVSQTHPTSPGERGLQHAGVAGIRCGIFMGAFQFFSFLLFYVWQ